MPPINIKVAIVPKPNPGRDESMSAVITTGPITEVVLIIEESNAYQKKQEQNQMQQTL